MTDPVRPQPVPVDLTGIETAHPEGEGIERLLGTAVAETAAGVPGVHRLGGSIAASVERSARALLGTVSAPGVTVLRDAHGTRIGLALVVEYPHVIRAVVDEARRQVVHAAAQIAPGPTVVDVTVIGVHGPGEAEAPAADGRDEGTTGVAP